MSESDSAWDRRRAAVARRIELVTLEACAAKGVDAVTVEEIARAAAISRRTFYRYFQTIDDVLCASPKRSLERVCQGVRERPAQESVRQAFVLGLSHHPPSEDERQVQVLSLEIIRRDPAGWDRAMGRIEAWTQEHFDSLARERLQGSGQDAALAPVVSVFLRAAVKHVATSAYSDGRMLGTPEDLDRALRDLAKILAD